MKDAQKISDDLLNAYVDGELSVEDQAEVIAALRQNPQLSEKLCELRALKEMVNVSYQNPPTPRSINDQQQTAYRHAWSLSGIAASIGLLITLALGTILGYQYGQQELGQFVQLNPASEQNQSVLLHIGTRNDERIQLALDNAEHILTSFAAKEKRIKLQILVNAEGIHMLNAENSPYISRIKAMSERFENVAFLACQRSIERQKLRGVEIHLVKEASVVPEALRTVVSRLESGWVYIRA